MRRCSRGDERTAAANYRIHGISFEQAAVACRDPRTLEWIDMRIDYGEERVILLGSHDGDILYVAYTERGDRTRIISARRATKHERDRYHRQNPS
jgi:uncharacterized DUF497 family protein